MRLACSRPVLTEQDIYLFREGTHFRAYEKLGSHPVEGAAAARGTEGAGTHFAVWAPNAQRVAVVGDFNGWRPDAHPLTPRPDASGIWQGFIPGVNQARTNSSHFDWGSRGTTVQKPDPNAYPPEVPRAPASTVWDRSYEWGDSEWMASRSRRNAFDAPQSVYEVHLGSWRRVPDDHNRPLNYRELAHQLGDYVTEMGFTHVELMPVMEHPFY